MTTITLTTIRFPDIALATRDAHKLRGFFGNLFKERSPLLHNHMEGGGFRYAYPLVQYKALDTTPMLIGINEGAELLTELFLNIDHIVIEDREYPIYAKNVCNATADVGIEAQLRRYRFQTLWMALNQRNYDTYMRADNTQRQTLLAQVLTGNILSFFKGVGLRVDERIMTLPVVEQKQTRFKDKDMIGFTGEFTANVALPEGIGLGKSVARGFGAIAVL